MRRGAALVVWLALLAPSTARATIEEALAIDPFGSVVTYREPADPTRVLILLSGADGWHRAAVEAARALATLDALVIGVDLPRYLATVADRGGDELYPSADLEVLSQAAQKKARLAFYRPPVVIGYGDGAAMAYAVGAQARPSTFAGVVSLGFCPALAAPRPLGRGSGLATTPGATAGGVAIAPSRTMATPWVALQGASSHGCDPESVRRFVAATEGARLLPIATSAREPVDAEHWLTTKPGMRAMRDTLDRLAGAPRSAATPSAAITDLPLIEVPARGAPTGTLAVILSGDGGWASLDRAVGDALADAGIGVVGWSSLAYFWTKRTPDGTATDLERVLRHYRRAWRASRVLLIGYSRGADVLPFLARRLPADLRDAVALVALLGPGRTTDFEFHLSDWLGGANPGALPVGPEVAALADLPVLCVQGDAETDSLCATLADAPVERWTLPGGHHFGGDYAVIAARILSEAGVYSRPSPVARASSIDSRPSPVDARPSPANTRPSPVDRQPSPRPPS